MSSKAPRANPEPSASDGQEVSLKLSADDMALIERALSGGMSGRVHGEQEAECLDAYSALREGVVPASPARAEPAGGWVAGSPDGAGHYWIHWHTTRDEWRTEAVNIGLAVLTMAAGSMRRIEWTVTHWQPLPECPK